MPNKTVVRPADGPITGLLSCNILRYHANIEQVGTRRRCVPRDTSSNKTNKNKIAGLLSHIRFQS